MRPGSGHKESVDAENEEVLVSDILRGGRCTRGWQKRLMGVADRPCKLGSRWCAAFVTAVCASSAKRECASKASSANIYGQSRAISSRPVGTHARGGRRRRRARRPPVSLDGLFAIGSQSFANDRRERRKGMVGTVVATA